MAKKSAGDKQVHVTPGKIANPVFSGDPLSAQSGPGRRGSASSGTLPGVGAKGSAPRSGALKPFGFGGKK